VKSLFHYDDALDVFGVHGVAGMVGMIFTGVFATTTVNSNLAVNLSQVVGHTLWREHLLAMAVTALFTAGATALIAFAIKATVGLRPRMEAEREGLDQNQHGENGYILDATNL
jgi:Amt family ammonium transporter